MTAFEVLKNYKSCLRSFTWLSCICTEAICTSLLSRLLIWVSPCFRATTLCRSLTVCFFWLVGGAVTRKQQWEELACNYWKYYCIYRWKESAAHNHNLQPRKTSKQLQMQQPIHLWGSLSSLRTLKPSLLILELMSERHVLCVCCKYVFCRVVFSTEQVVILWCNQRWKIVGECEKSWYASSSKSCSRAAQPSGSCKDVDQLCLAFGKFSRAPGLSSWDGFP